MDARKPVIIDQANLDWEGWRDADLAAKSAIRWKLLITGERTESSGLVTGVVEIPPGAHLLLHHHEPEETYYVVSQPRRDGDRRSRNDGRARLRDLRPA